MKKVLSAVLALVMAAGMATTAFAADISAMTQSDIAKTSNLKLFVSEDGNFYDKEYKFTEKFKVAEDDDASKVTNLKTGVYASDATYIYLLAKIGDGNTPGAGLTYATGTNIDNGDWAYVSKNQVKRWDLSVKMTKSSTNIEKVEIAYLDSDSKAIVLVNFQDALASTGTKTSNDTIVIYSGDKKMRSSDLKIETKLENNAGNNKIEDENVEEIYADSPTSRVVDVKKYQPKVKVYTEYDGIITTRLYEKKYYFEMSEKPDATAIAVMDKYGFEMYRKLTQVGLGDSSTITFDIDDTFFVYGIAADANYDAVADSVQLVYLGKSNAQLPITTDYFFSVKELTIETAPTEEPPVESSTDPSESTNPPTGPVEVPSNGNFNPGTGR